MNLKRSSSAPMINQLGVAPPPENPRDRLTLNIHGLSTGSGEAGPSSSCSTPSGTNSANNREVSMELDAASFASSFLASLNNPRPRRFSASFSPVSYWFTTLKQPFTGLLSRYFFEHLIRVHLVQLQIA